MLEEYFKSYFDKFSELVETRFSDKNYIYDKKQIKTEEDVHHYREDHIEYMKNPHPALCEHCRRYPCPDALKFYSIISQEGIQLRSLEAQTLFHNKPIYKKIMRCLSQRMYWFFILGDPVFKQASDIHSLVSSDEWRRKMNRAERYVTKNSQHALTEYFGNRSRKRKSDRYPIKISFFSESLIVIPESLSVEC